MLTVVAVNIAAERIIPTMVTRVRVRFSFRFFKVTFWKMFIGGSPRLW